MPLMAQDGAQPVLLDHDGGMPDDYLATALVAGMANVDLLGVVVTPADCEIRPAVLATRRLLPLAGRPRVPVAPSTVRPVNPFPEPWRRSSRRMPPLLDRRAQAPLAGFPGQQFLARQLELATAPVTLAVTGPLSTIAAALALNPAVEKKIRRILWMGGAIDVPGNVVEPGHDGSAEWNVYWDPPAAAALWRTAIPILMCPLDITNSVPLTRDFLNRLKSLTSFPIAALAHRAYDTSAGDGELYFWDLLTVAWLARPDLFSIRTVETEIVTEGPSQGRTRRATSGRRVDVLHQVDREAFYQWLLSAWSK